MSNRQRRATRRRKLERVIAIVLIAVPIALVALWLTFQHKPAWYRPAILDEAGIELAKQKSVGMVDFVSDRMVEGKPFEVVLQDEAVNRWLAALPFAYPEARKTMPAELSEPAFRFDDGEIRIGAHYTDGAWQVILSVGIAFNVSSGGDEFEITVKDLRGGSLKAPRFFLANVVDPLLEDVRSDGPANEEVPRTLRSLLRRAGSVDGLFDGVVVENRFVWFNGERPFRIDSLSIDKGELRLRIEPL